MFSKVHASQVRRKQDFKTSNRENASGEFSKLRKYIVGSCGSVQIGNLYQYTCRNVFYLSFIKHKTHRVNSPGRQVETLLLVQQVKDACRVAKSNEVSIF